jgi:hypothetical protein
LLYDNQAVRLEEMSVVVPDFLRDPIWQVVGVVAAFIAIVATVLIYYKQRQQKKLSYRITSNTPLLSIDEAIKEDLQILYHGKDIKQANLVTIDIINSGNLPITTADYEQTVNISFGKDAQILSAEITTMRPQNINATIHVDKEVVTLNPVLLNADDSISLKFIVSYQSKGPIFGGRIVGVKDIKELSDDPKWLMLAIPGIFTFFAGLVLAVGSLFFAWPGFFISGFISAFGYAIMAIAVLADNRERKRLVKSMKKVFPVLFS